MLKELDAGKYWMLPTMPIAKVEVLMNHIAPDGGWYWIRVSGNTVLGVVNAKVKVAV